MAHPLWPTVNEGQTKNMTCSFLLCTFTGALMKTLLRSTFVPLSTWWELSYVAKTCNQITTEHEIPHIFLFLMASSDYDMLSSQWKSSTTVESPFNFWCSFSNVVFEWSYHDGEPTSRSHLKVSNIAQTCNQFTIEHPFIWLLMATSYWYA